MTYEEALKIAQNADDKKESFQRKMYGNLTHSCYDGHYLLTNIDKKWWNKYKDRVESGELIIGKAFYSGYQGKKEYIKDYIGLFIAKE